MTDQDVRYVGESAGGQRRTKNRPSRNMADSDELDDKTQLPPTYGEVHGKKNKKSKKTPAGAAAAASRDDGRRNVCHILMFSSVYSLNEQLTIRNHTS